MRFEMPKLLRQRLWESGLSGVESALRYAAIEFDLYLLSTNPDLELLGDDGHRHFANFLAWSDTTLAGIDAAVKKTGDQSLMRRWTSLENPTRARMHADRNDALKGRHHVLQWETVWTSSDGSYAQTPRFSSSPSSGWDEPVIGTCTDYLCWIRDVALLLALEASASPSSSLSEDDLSAIPSPDADPWTTHVAWEVRFALDDWT